jgi:hypothetical protein
MKLSLRLVLLSAAVALGLAGCNHYIPPGPKADLQSLAPTDIQAGFAAKPSRPFPAAIAVVRLQGSGYRNHYVDQNGGVYGSGRYSVVLAREVEEQKELDRITQLPQVAGVIGLNRMLLPANLENEQQLREAASRLQADMILLYTFDTAFFDHDAARPLSVITLGLSPTRKITAMTTASALLVDTRTGYIYSAYETTEREATLATSWNTSDTADEARRATEKRAFAKLVDEFSASWPKLLERYQAKSG